MTSLLTRALIRYLLPLKNPTRSTTAVYMSSSSSLPSSSSSLPSSSSSSWFCPRCTFLNPSYQRVSCQMCLSATATATATATAGGGGSSFSVGASASPGRWPCTACTYLNPNGRAFCEVCGTRAAPFSRFLGDCLDPEELSAADSSIGSVFLPLQRCGSKRPAPVEAAADSRPLEKLARSEKDEHLVLSGMLGKTEKAKN